MSYYKLVPPPDLNDNAFATWENGFSAEEVAGIRRIGDAMLLAPAVISGGIVDKEIRKSTVAWISENDQTRWLYDKLGFIARQINAQFFNLDIDCFIEDLQYTVYEEGGDHYGWHVDKGLTPAPRKLSMVLHLSDPTEFDGGELQIQTGPNPTTLGKVQGLVNIFPSYVLHQVTPVTRGTRRSLVAWLCGPRFR
jgi:PKHD-type hydroxylase